MNEEITLTTTFGHGYIAGEGTTLKFSSRHGRLKRLWNLIRSPKMAYVTNMTRTTISVAYRPMTWAEWRMSFMDILLDR